MYKFYGILLGRFSATGDIAMKYVKALTDGEKMTLEEALKNHMTARVRARAHAILLSDRKFKINEIGRIFRVDRDTASHWLNNWEVYGIIGLYDEFRPGRPSKLSETEQKEVKKLIEEEPRSMKIVSAQVLEKFHKTLSVDTLKRLAKGMKFSWRRIRKSLKKKRNQAEFEKISEEIEELRASSQVGLVDLYYFDESGFSLQPMVPYAWQGKGETIEVFPRRSGYLNVLGFLNIQKGLESFVFEDRVDTHVVVACFDAFSENLNKPTWVVIDNASQHTSHIFKSKIPEWEKRNLFIQYLPAYSPELNLIEILWRFIKYIWLPFSAYLNFESLKNALEEILRNVGKKYQIIFA